MSRAGSTRCRAGDLYVVGARTAFRLRWDGERLERDAEWGAPYLLPGKSYGWDPVIAGGQLWFLDNGAHDFVTTMRGAGVAPGAVDLIRMSLEDPDDRERVEVCGAARGAVTDPPLYDAERRVAIAYDSANGVVQAFRFGERVTPLWRKEISHSAHMILDPQTGELVLHDFHGPALARTRAARAIGGRATSVMRRPALRRLATRTAATRSWSSTSRPAPSAAGPQCRACSSPSYSRPGFDRDLYWCTMTTLARVAVV